MASLVIVFASGLFWVQQWSHLPSYITSIFLLLVFILAFHRKSFYLASFLAGVIWAVLFAQDRLADRINASDYDRIHTIQGCVINFPRFDGIKTQFDFLVTAPEFLKSRKIRLSWYASEKKVLSAQNWKFDVKLKAVRGRYNPGGFDYERWMFEHNYVATGYVKNQSHALQLSKTLNILQLRYKIDQKMDEVFSESEFIGLIKALTIGNRQQLTQEQWLLFRKTGIAHLMAISGMHIGLVSGLTFTLFRFVAIRMHCVSPQNIAAVFAILSAGCYSFLAGFSLPTQRALIMLTLVMLAVIWKRNHRSLQLVAVAAFLILLLQPLAVVSKGLSLSFLAVVLIIYGLSGRLKKINTGRTTVKIHLIVSFGLAPLLLLYFEEFSVVAPWVNLLVVPLVGFIILPLSLLAVMLLLFFPDGALLILSLLNLIFKYLLGALELLSDLPIGYTMVKPELWSVILAMIGMVLVFVPRGMPVRSLAMLFFLPVFFPMSIIPDNKLFRMTVLDVGQGLAVVIEVENHVLVYDSGARYSAFSDMGAQVVLPYLKYRSIDQVDMFMISHADNDHIGGAESILASGLVDQVSVSHHISLPDDGYSHCKSGQKWRWGKVLFSVLSPPAVGVFRSENDNSCVLFIDTGEIRILLSGDIESQAEQWLVTQYHDSLKADILLVPHHGSKTSSSQAFIDLVAPEYAIISSGFKNRFQQPHLEVLERYRENHVKVFNTATLGALTVELLNSEISLFSERRKQAKYWTN